MEADPPKTDEQRPDPGFLRRNARRPKIAAKVQDENQFTRFLRKLFCIRYMLVLILACVLGVVGRQAFLGREPSFEGKRFSEWIWTMNGKAAGPEKEEARAVVRRLGANSVPLLLDWLRREDRPSMTARFDEVRHQVFFWLGNHKIIANRSITSLQDFNPSHNAMAMWALAELDPVSRRTAIPSRSRCSETSGPNQMKRLAWPDVPVWFCQKWSRNQLLR